MDRDAASGAGLVHDRGEERGQRAAGAYPGKLLRLRPRNAEPGGGPRKSPRGRLTSPRPRRSPSIPGSRAWGRPAGGSSCRGRRTGERGGGGDRFRLEHRHQRGRGQLAGQSPFIQLQAGPGAARGSLGQGARVRIWGLRLPREGTTGWTMSVSGTPRATPRSWRLPPSRRARTARSAAGGPGGRGRRRLRRHRGQRGAGARAN